MQAQVQGVKSFKGFLIVSANRICVG